jgi:release factor glutamine methyltransferase
MISELAASHLTKNGKLYFEINEAYGNNIKQMLEDKGFIDIIVNKDLNNKDRFVRSGI